MPALRVGFALLRKINAGFVHVFVGLGLPASKGLTAGIWVWLALMSVGLVVGSVGCYLFLCSAIFGVHLMDALTEPTLTLGSLCMRVAWPPFVLALLIANLSHIWRNYHAKRAQLFNILGDATLVRHASMAPTFDLGMQHVGVFIMMGLTLVLAGLFDSNVPRIILIGCTVLAHFVALVVAYEKIIRQRCAAIEDKFRDIPEAAKALVIQKAKAAGVDTDSRGFMKAAVAAYEKNGARAQAAAAELERQTPSVPIATARRL